MPMKEWYRLPHSYNAVVKKYIDVSFSSPSSYTVVLGSHDRRTVEAGEEEITVKQYIKHPVYNKPYPINNDIALLQLSVPAELGPRINTVCLPPQDYNVPLVTSQCYITGKRRNKSPLSSIVESEQ